MSWKTRFIKYSTQKSKFHVVYITPHYSIEYYGKLTKKNKNCRTDLKQFCFYNNIYEQFGLQVNVFLNH